MYYSVVKLNRRGWGVQNPVGLIIPLKPVQTRHPLPTQPRTSKSRGLCVYGVFDIISPLAV